CAGNGLERAFYCLRDLSVISDVFTVGSEGLGEDREVRVTQLSAGNPSRVVRFLVVANGRELPVIHDDRQDRSAVLHRSCKLLTVHKEFSITADGHNDAFWSLFGRSYSRWNRVAHGPIACTERGREYVRRHIPLGPSGVVPSTDGINHVRRQPSD